MSGDVEALAAVLAEHHYVSLVCNTGGWSWRCQCGLRLLSAGLVGMTAGTGAGDAIIARHCDHQADAVLNVLREAAR